MGRMYKGTALEVENEFHHYVVDAIVFFGTMWLLLQL